MVGGWVGGWWVGYSGRSKGLDWDGGEGRGGEGESPCTNKHGVVTDRPTYLSERGHLRDGVLPPQPPVLPDEARVRLLHHHEAALSALRHPHPAAAAAVALSLPLLLLRVRRLLGHQHLREPEAHAVLGLAQLVHQQERPPHRHARARVQRLERLPRVRGRVRGRPHQEGADAGPGQALREVEGGRGHHHLLRLLLLHRGHAVGAAAVGAGAAARVEPGVCVCGGLMSVGLGSGWIRKGARASGQGGHKAGEEGTGTRPRQSQQGQGGERSPIKQVRKAFLPKPGCAPRRAGSGGLARRHGVAYSS